MKREMGTGRGIEGQGVGEGVRGEEGEEQVGVAHLG